MPGAFRQIDREDSKGGYPSDKNGGTSAVGRGREELNALIKSGREIPQNEATAALWTYVLCNDAISVEACISAGADLAAIMHADAIAIAGAGITEANGIYLPGFLDVRERMHYVHQNGENVEVLRGDFGDWAIIQNGEKLYSTMRPQSGEPRPKPPKIGWFSTAGVPPVPLVLGEMDGWSLTKLAAMLGYGKVLQVLLQKGAKSDDEDLFVAILAAINARNDCSDIQALIQLGAPLPPSEAGEVLWAYVASENVSAIALCTSRGADLKAQLPDQAVIVAGSGVSSANGVYRAGQDEEGRVHFVASGSGGFKIKPDKSGWTLYQMDEPLYYVDRAKNADKTKNADKQDKTKQRMRFSSSQPAPPRQGWRVYTAGQSPAPVVLSRDGEDITVSFLAASLGMGKVMEALHSAGAEMGDDLLRVALAAALDRRRPVADLKALSKLGVTMQKSQAQEALWGYAAQGNGAAVSLCIAAGADIMLASPERSVIVAGSGTAAADGLYVPSGSDTRGKKLFNAFDRSETTLRYKSDSSNVWGMYRNDALLYYVRTEQSEPPQEGWTVLCGESPAPKVLTAGGWLVAQVGAALGHVDVLMELARLS